VLVLLAAMLVLLGSSIPAFVIIKRQRAVSRSGMIAFAGMEIALVGLILTPGLAWGDTDDYDSAIGRISNIAFFLGVGLLIWAAVLWGRGRLRSRQG
jgi:hypothetical protein